MEWRDRRRSVIAQGSLTNSKRDDEYILGVYPTSIQRAKGAIITDSDGNQYIDYVMGLGGAGVLGYANDQITEAVHGQMKKGSIFSFASELEVEVAEMLQSIFPKCRKWRFLKTGTEGVMAAVRIARAFTGKDHVLSQGYHGWSDEFTRMTPPAVGVPRISPLITEFDETKHLGGAGTVVLEPVMLDASEERRNMLRGLRIACDKANALLVFDEVITGMRWKNWAVTKDWSVQPDILVLGKALASGLPLAAVGMTDAVANSGEWFVSSTFAGDCAALAACKKTIEILKADKPLDWLWDRGQRFLDKFNSMDEDIQIVGYPLRGTFKEGNIKKNLFWQECARAGIVFGRAFMYTYAHPDHDDEVLSICADIIQNIKLNWQRMELENEPRRSFKR